MNDPLELARQWLLASSAVQAIAASFGSPTTWAVFCEVLPENYDPTSASAVVLSIKGGSGHAEIGKVWDGELQVKCWAGINQFMLARALYGACYDTMHSQSMVSFSGFGTVVTSYEFSTGQGAADPDAGWATVTGAFRMITRDDSGVPLPTWVDNTQSAKAYIDGLVAAEDAVLNGGNFS